MKAQLVKNWTAVAAEEEIQLVHSLQKCCGRYRKASVQIFLSFQQGGSAPASETSVQYRITK
jgi:hypothetical protein